MTFLLGIPLVLALLPTDYAALRDGPGPIVYRVAGMDRVVVQQDIPYKHAGQTELKFDLYLPQGDPPRAGWPLAILIHGGPISPETRPKDWLAFQSFGRAVAASGIGAVTFNYRFPSTSALPHALEDLKDLLDELRSRAKDRKIDPDRLCLWAFSGGGPQLTLAFGEARPYIRCVLSFYAPLDAPAALVPYSPLAQLKAHAMTAPPVFIARMGKDSPRINRSVDEFVSEARRLKVPVTLKEYADGIHAFDIAQDTDESRAIIEAAIAFAKSHLLAPADNAKGGESEVIVP
jgi:acetyl esterase/lipase